MIRPLNHQQEVSLPDSFTGVDNQSWLSTYTNDFKKRMTTLLGFEFRKLPSQLAFQLVHFEDDSKSGDLSALEAKDTFNSHLVSKELIDRYISVFDLKRLESYSKNLVDFHLITDLVPTIARLHLSELAPGTVHLSYVQTALLVGMGLQFKSIDQLVVELKLAANQLLPLFNKSIRKFTRLFKEVIEREIEAELDRELEDTKNEANAGQLKRI